MIIVYVFLFLACIVGSFACLNESYSGRSDDTGNWFFFAAWALMIVAFLFLCMATV